MPSDAAPPKPVTTNIRPEITRLPEITPARRIFRRLVVMILCLLAKLLLRLEVYGVENTPPSGPLLVVSNHLGDFDVPVGLVISPRPVDAFVKADLYDYPLLGWIMRAYGVVWIHRGQPDRRAIRAGLAALEQGRLIAIAPEGRESLIGALEAGTPGAAYLALKSGAAILPMAFTGTENHSIVGALRRLRRSQVSVQIGPPFHLADGDGDWRLAVEQGTDQIMRSLAELLPPEYQGVYKEPFTTRNGGSQ
jgi:1-acyl-sn-glycerol-3-phosphate acyltransferase